MKPSEYLTELRRNINLHRLSRKQGWKDGGFVFAGVYHKPSGNAVFIPDETGIALGSWENWAEATSVIKNVQHQLTLLLGFASPLISIFDTGGITVVPYGSNLQPLMRSMLSIWGDPDSQTLPSGVNITTAICKWDETNDLPVVMEGIGDDVMVNISKLSDKFSAGRFSLKITADDIILEKSWAGILMLPAREGILDRIYMNRGQAMVSPIFDYHTEVTEQLPEDEFFRNRGSAGSLYASYLVKNHSAIRKHLLAVDQITWKTISLPANYRHFSHLVSAITVAAAIAKNTGLVRFDIAPAVAYATHRCYEIRGILSRKKKSKSHKGVIHNRNKSKIRQKRLNQSINELS